MTPRAVIDKWVKAFNDRDLVMLENLYAPEALNHQMPLGKFEGRQAIVDMFRNEFEQWPHMHCIPIQVIVENDWAVLEWKDPNGLQGCGFFHIVNDQIIMQRGYWDKSGLGIPDRNSQSSIKL